MPEAVIAILVYLWVARSHRRAHHSVGLVSREQHRRAELWSTVIDPNETVLWKQYFEILGG
jgi:hypothetical protein